MSIRFDRLIRILKMFLGVSFSNIGKNPRQNKEISVYVSCLNRNSVFQKPPPPKKKLPTDFFVIVVYTV